MDTGFQRNVINYMLRSKTITGSIGVFGLLPNLKKMASEYSVYWDAVKTHDHSDIMTIARPKTEAELQVIQEYVNGIYQKFIGLVADARKINPKRVDRIAEGRVWSGLDAKRLGLVDGFGGLRESIQKAAELAKLEPGSFGVKEVPALQTPFQALEDMFAVSQGGVSIHLLRLFPHKGNYRGIGKCPVFSSNSE